MTIPIDSFDLALLGLIGNYGWGCFRPEADAPKRPHSAKSKLPRVSAQRESIQTMGCRCSQLIAFCGYIRPASSPFLGQNGNIAVALTFGWRTQGCFLGRETIQIEV